MWQRFSIHDVRSVGHYLGGLILVAGATQVIPLVMALACCEWSTASRYLLSAGTAASIGTGLRMLRIRPGRLNRTQATTVIVLGWMAMGLIGALPLALCGHYANYLDALFDAVSAYSTTGVSLVCDLDHLSIADNMWRFTMHFVGGLGLVVVAVSFGTMRSIGSSLYRAEGHDEHLLPDIQSDTRFVLRFSLTVVGLATVLLSILLIISGMRVEQSVLQALWLSIGGLMTAGFTPMSTGIAYYHSVLVECFLMVFMIIGSINFNLQIATLHGQRTSFLKDIEVRTAGIVWTVLFVCFALMLAHTSPSSGMSSIERTELFNFISAVTTTGFDYVTPSQMQALFPAGAFIVLALGMAIGTSVESTGGGIKLLRLGVLVKAAAAAVVGKLRPNAREAAGSFYHFEHCSADKVAISQAATILGLFAAVSAIGALVGMAYGHDIVSSVFESVAMASNGGVSCGISSPGMPAPLELTYIMEMWMGRLEFLAFFTLIVKLVASVAKARQKPKTRKQVGTAR